MSGPVTRERTRAPSSAASDGDDAQTGCETRPRHLHQARLPLRVAGFFLYAGHADPLRCGQDRLAGTERSFSQSWRCSALRRSGSLTASRT